MAVVFVFSKNREFSLPMRVGVTPLVPHVGLVLGQKNAGDGIITGNSITQAECGYFLRASHDLDGAWNFTKVSQAGAAERGEDKGQNPQRSSTVMLIVSMVMLSESAVATHKSTVSFWDKL